MPLRQPNTRLDQTPLCDASEAFTSSSLCGRHHASPLYSGGCYSMNSSLPGRTGLICSALAALACAMVATLIIHRFQLDLTLAQWIYALEGHEWTLKEHWLFSELLHQRGRQLSIALLLLCLILLLASGIHPRLRPYRRVLAYLVISPLIASGVILLGKRSLGVECPWSLQPFGGDVPYSPLLQQLFNHGSESCFPAGHASAGYAWLALYFAAATVQPRWRYAALALALGLGLLFGTTQQLRGAHFLSHDIWSFTLCWSINALLAALMLAPRRDCSLHPDSSMIQLKSVSERLPNVSDFRSTSR